MPDDAVPSASCLPSDNAESVLAELVDKGFASVQHIASTGSTNADLLQPALAEVPGGAVLRWADHQVSGRGRRGRSWFSGPGQALTFSVALERRVPAEPDPAPASAFSLVAGLAVAETLEASGLSAAPVLLKWPNDIVINERKVVGILIELKQRGDVQRMVVGCGINLIAPPSGAVTERASQALLPGGLLQAGNEGLDRGEGAGHNEPPLPAQRAARLVAEIALALQACHRQFFAQGMSGFIERWSARHCYQGQTIMLMDAQQTLAQGRCLGIDHQGSLVIESERGRETFTIGEVSARPLSGASPGATT